jgi:hypothetical protein
MLREPREFRQHVPLDRKHQPGRLEAGYIIMEQVNINDEWWKHHCSCHSLLETGLVR